MYFECYFSIGANSLTSYSSISARRYIQWQVIYQVASQGHKSHSYAILICHPPSPWQIIQYIDFGHLVCSSIVNFLA
jgi:hypothetical protein